MAIDMQHAIFSLPMKLEKLHFFQDDVSTETMSTILPSLHTKVTPPLEYDVRPIKTSDIDAVIVHLREFFFKDEPLNIDVKLLEGENGKCIELEEYSIKSIKAHPDLTLVAVSKSNSVVGVAINGIETRGEVHEDEGDCPNHKFDKILKLLGHVDCELDIFKRYPNAKTIMNCKILSVDSTWRGKGIAKKLMDKTRDIALKQGYNLLRVDCTSAFSAKVVARLGFEEIYRLKYADYKQNGQVVFDPEPPHTEVTVYVQKLK